MEDERYIINKVGKENPFRVPEGYFDTLASQVMARIDEQPQKARVVRLRRFYYAAAASVCVLCLSVAAYFAFSQESPQPTVAEMAVLQPVQADEDDFEQAADYLMVDNQDIYACLASDY